MPEGRIRFKLGESHARYNVIIVNLDPERVPELIELINRTDGCFASEGEWIPGFNQIIAYADDAAGYARLGETLALATTRGLLKPESAKVN